MRTELISTCPPGDSLSEREEKYRGQIMLGPSSGVALLEVVSSSNVSTVKLEGGVRWYGKRPAAGTSP
jgi:hypothetical protein